MSFQSNAFLVYPVRIDTCNYFSNTNCLVMALALSHHTSTTSVHFHHPFKRLFKIHNFCPPFVINNHFKTHFTNVSIKLFKKKTFSKHFRLYNFLYLNHIFAPSLSTIHTQVIDSIPYRYATLILTSCVVFPLIIDQSSRACLVVDQ